MLSEGVAVDSGSYYFRSATTPGMMAAIHLYEGEGERLTYTLTLEDGIQQVDTCEGQFILSNEAEWRALNQRVQPVLDARKVLGELEADDWEDTDVTPSRAASVIRGLLHVIEESEGEEDNDAAQTGD